MYAVLCHFYHLKYQDFEIIPLRRIWTLWDELPEVAKLFLGGNDKASPRGELSIEEKRRLIRMAKERGIKPPKYFNIPKRGLIK